MSDLQHGMTRSEIEDYQRTWGIGPHVAADLAVVTIPWDADDPGVRLLLIRRAHPPFQGAYAFPGGFVERGEDLETAARRELGEEAGLADLGSAWVEQLQSYGQPDRDPRARVISVVFLALVPWCDLPPAQAGDDASEARLMRIRGGSALDDAGKEIALAFDHDRVLRDLCARLRLVASFSSAPALLAGSEFTLERVRGAYEALLETRLQQSRFEEWILKQGWLERIEGKGTYRLRERRPSWVAPAPSWLP